VITNDTLPEAKGPANGAAILPEDNTSGEQIAGEEGQAKPAAVASSDASGATTPDTAKPDPEKELREQVQFLDGQISTLNSKVENETNEASREVMEKLVASYQEQRDSSQQQLDALTAAKDKTKSSDK
jgi:hypothetical protein